MPILGGHLTLGHAPALSATCTGFTKAPLRASAARPGDVLLAAFAIDGRYMSDADDFFTRAPRPPPDACSRPTARRSSRSPSRASATRRATSSMPGIAGSLLQMIEGAGTGATLDVDAIPRPTGVALERWLLTFPSFGFLLAAPPRRPTRRVAFPRPRARLRAVRHVRRARAC